MLGFAPLAALPIADDAEGEDQAPAILAMAVLIGGTRLNSSHEGGQRPAAALSGSTLIQIGQ